MKLYRFSPIKNKTQLLRAINYLHFESFKLCREKLGRILPVAGNIGIFCHYEKEYKLLTKIRERLTDPNDSFNGKYFRLYKPIVIPAKKGIPETSYTYLYIRKPDPYRFHVGDVDFYLNSREFQKLKKSLVPGNNISGIRLFERVEENMIEPFDPDSDVLAYIRMK